MQPEARENPRRPLCTFTAITESWGNCLKCTYLALTKHIFLFLPVQFAIPFYLSVLRSGRTDTNTVKLNFKLHVDVPTLFLTSADNPYEGPLVDMSWFGSWRVKRELKNKNCSELSWLSLSMKKQQTKYFLSVLRPPIRASILVKNQSGGKRVIHPFTGTKVPVLRFLSNRIRFLHKFNCERYLMWAKNTELFR